MATLCIHYRLIFPKYFTKSFIQRGYTVYIKLVQNLLPGFLVWLCSNIKHKMTSIINKENLQRHNKFIQHCKVGGPSSIDSILAKAKLHQNDGLYRKLAEFFIKKLICIPSGLSK